MGHVDVDPICRLAEHLAAGQLALGDGEVWPEQPPGFVRRDEELVKLCDTGGPYAPALKRLEEQTFQVLKSAQSQATASEPRQSAAARRQARHSTLRTPSPLRRTTRLPSQAPAQAAARNGTVTGPGITQDARRTLAATRWAMRCLVSLASHLPGPPRQAAECLSHASIGVQACFATTRSATTRSHTLGPRP